MGSTIMGAVVSLDGRIAHDDDDVGPLFDFYGNGSIEWAYTEQEQYPFHTTQATKDFLTGVYSDVGCIVMGRRLFDHTNGWNGVPAAGEHVFVVTHAVPTDWEHLGSAPFTFVTDGVAAAIAMARDFAGADRDVDVAAGQIGGQALRLGLIDTVVLNLVPVVFGAGRPYFAAMGAGDVVTLADPQRVVQGDRVTHLLFDVTGSAPRAPQRPDGTLAWASDE